MKKNNIIKNTSWLFVFNIAKILFPFITLPYLTRVLSVETYGVVTYVKTVMSYMQIFVDFGFVLSGTKEIIYYLSKKKFKKINYVIGDTLCSRIILGLIGFVSLLFLSFFLPILRKNLLFTILSYFVVFESIFLMDFVFRGFEKMHVIAIRFVFMKILSTICTFLLIKSDVNLLLIPILDIISSFVAIIMVYFELKKINIKLSISNIHNILSKIKDSFVYFLSSAASCSFNALSTIIIGILLNEMDVAFWGICIQIIGTIQALYNPICDGIYPEMLKTKNINLVKKSLYFFVPIVSLGSILAYFCAPLGMLILGGNKYLVAVPIFRILILCLILCFPSVLLGWPTLGAIDRADLVTKSTIVSIVFNIFMLLFLIISDSFSLINIAIVRVLTELVLLILRVYYFLKLKNKFNN